MIKRLLAGTALSVLPFIALAADLPSRKSAKLPTLAASSFNWAGFYAGGSLGGVVGKDKLDLVGWDATTHINPQGLSFGGYAGYNVQSGKIVWGVEANADLLAVRKRGIVEGPFNADGWKDKASIGAALRARVGYLVDDKILVYVTGGPSLLRQTLKNDCSDCGFALLPLDWSKTRIGFEVGAGAEYALTNKISLKAEYLFGDYQKTSLASGDGYDVSSTLQTHTVRVGAAYHF